MAVVVDKVLNVEASPETVWSLLVNVESWSQWWPGLVNARALDARTLHEGSKLEVVVQPRHSKITFHPIVDMITEGKTLSLTHESVFLQGTVVWNVAEGPTGSKVIVRGVFKGFKIWVMGLLSQNTIFEAALGAAARGLKRLAGRMG